MNVFSYEQADGWHNPPMASKMVGIKLKRGQAVRLETPGGGGYGDAARARDRRRWRGMWPWGLLSPD